MSFSQKPTRRETEKGEEQRGETLVCVCVVLCCVWPCMSRLRLTTLPMSVTADCRLFGCREPRLWGEKSVSYDCEQGEGLNLNCVHLK